MVIEYLGVSGVGKTTLAEKDYIKLLQDGKCVYWYSKDLYKNRGWLIRNIIKAGHVLLYSFSHLKWVIEYRDFLDAHIPNKKDTYTLLFNGIFLKKCCRLIKILMIYIFLMKGHCNTYGQYI